MDDVDRPRASGPQVGRTALGRLELRVPDEDGYDEVAVERRWPSARAARAWCERSVRRLDSGTTVLEIQVFEERWSHAKSWETTGHHPLAESMQVGMVVDGGVRWTHPHPMVPRPAAQHLL